MDRKELSKAARLLGLKGGPARARKLRAEKRRDIAKAGARAKWAKVRSKAARRRATEAARAARWLKKRSR
jgi:hypothetical protein